MERFYGIPSKFVYWNLATDQQVGRSGLCQQMCDSGHRVTGGDGEKRNLSTKQAKFSSEKCDCICGQF